MKFGINVSIFLTDGAALGNLTGDIDVSMALLVGDTISFTSPRKSTRAHLGTSFTGILRIKDRILIANEHASPLLSLSDIVVADRGAAKAVIDYLEDGFDMFFAPYAAWDSTS